MYCVPNRLPDVATMEAALLESDRRTCNKACAQRSSTQNSRSNKRKKLPVRAGGVTILWVRSLQANYLCKLQAN